MIALRHDAGTSSASTLSRLRRQCVPSQNTRMQPSPTAKLAAHGARRVEQRHVMPDHDHMRPSIPPAHAVSQWAEVHRPCADSQAIDLWLPRVHIQRQEPCSMPAVREAVVDGLFYPATPSALRALIVDYLIGVGAVDDAERGPPKLLITPHAGYEYCGAVAAQAYALLGRRGARAISRVVMLGPAHRVTLDGLAAPQAQAFETPLGRVALDCAALASLDDLPQVTRSDRAHECEHSLEVQLPFLQTLLGSSFTLVPLVVGAAGAEAVAQVLERLWGSDETLIVVSSDFSRYLPYEQARVANRATAQRILALAPTGAARGLRGQRDQWRAAGVASPWSRAAPAGSAQLRRYCR
jgi:MEMO1 family protein